MKAQNDILTAPAITADARRVRGILKSPLPAPLSVEQMDEAIGQRMRTRHRRTHRRAAILRKP